MEEVSRSKTLDTLSLQNSGIGKIPVACEGVQSAPFASVKWDHSVVHPVQHIQRSHAMNERALKRQIQANTYGTHFVMRQQMEEQIVRQFHRLPGIHSEFLALELLQGRDQHLEFEDYMNLPSETPEFSRASMHTVMEARLGMLPVEGAPPAPREF